MYLELCISSNDLVRLRNDVWYGMMGLLNENLRACVNMLDFKSHFGCLIVKAVPHQINLPSLPSSPASAAWAREQSFTSTALSVLGFNPLNPSLPVSIPQPQSSRRLSAAVNTNVTFFYQSWCAHIKTDVLPLGLKAALNGGIFV